MTAAAALLPAFAPIWALAGLGWFAERVGVLGERAEATLGAFVFYLAMPAALMVTISRRPAEAWQWSPIAAFAIAAGISLGLGYAISWLVFRRTRGERALGAMSAGYGNSGNLGLPVAVHVLGDVSFLAQVILLQVLVFTPVILTVLDRSRAAAGADDRRPRLLTLPLRNPVVLGALAGVAVSVTGWRLPGPVVETASLLGAAAVPAALVALGASLRRGAVGDGPWIREVTALAALKVVGQPLLAYLVARWLFGLTGPQLLAVVVVAALPAAQNTYVFATIHRTAVETTRRTVLVTTAVSMLTLPVIAAGVG